MSIPAGTLCLIVRPHPIAGRTCIVVSFTSRGHYRVWNRTASGELRGGYKRRRGSIYSITGALPPAPGGGSVWGAEPGHLVPLAPPEPTSIATPADESAAHEAAKF
ncbi:MAG: hypothetical protein J0L91_00245 [Burkholderiales bacterium]|nr:hypothetical protein [Burkholderiales bacterium]